MAEYIEREAALNFVNGWREQLIPTYGKEDIDHFKNTNGVTEEYFVDQWTGYCEDDFHGELYFKTDVPGQYVRVHFDM